jgi:hypothetical protein
MILFVNITHSINTLSFLIFVHFNGIFLFFGPFDIHIMAPKEAGHALRLRFRACPLL